MINAGILVQVTRRRSNPVPQVTWRLDKIRFLETERLRHPSRWRIAANIANSAHIQCCRLFERTCHGQHHRHRQERHIPRAMRHLCLCQPVRAHQTRGYSNHGTTCHSLATPPVTRQRRRFTASRRKQQTMEWISGRSTHQGRSSRRNSSDPGMWFRMERRHRHLMPSSESSAPQRQALYPVPICLQILAPLSFSLYFISFFPHLFLYIS